MKLITRDAVIAFLNNYEFKRGNTEVTIGKDREIILFGNTIARYNMGNIEISDCGWITVTTKERLNGLLEMLDAPKLYQRDYVWYYDRDDEKRCFNSDKQSNGFVSVSYMQGE
jgi:hypothetical protein